MYIELFIFLFLFLYHFCFLLQAPVPGDIAESILQEQGLVLC